MILFPLGIDEAAVDRVYAEEKEKGNVKPDGTLHLLGFLPRDELFGELLTHPISFPYMWGLAGWNIYTHHNHLDVTPPPGDYKGDQQSLYDRGGQARDALIDLGPLSHHALPRNRLTPGFLLP